MAKKDTTAIYLAINIFAFLCCWAAAMGLLSWFDAPIGILLVFATVAGYLQGGLREVLNLIFGISAILVAWVLAVWVAHTTNFGFFFSGLHYAYIVWFVIFALGFLYLSKKLLFAVMRKFHSKVWLRDISFRLGVATGIIKGFVLCYLYLGIVYFSSFLMTNFPEQVKSSLILPTFVSVEEKYHIAETADLLGGRYRIMDMESRWKLHGLMGDFYPGEYDVQRKALNILIPVVYNNKAISEFRDSKDGKNFVQVVSKLKNAKKIWKKNINGIRTLKAPTHTPRKILIFLYQKRLQELLKSEEVKKFLREMP
ncbi:CvpA family protein [Candidatus Uabimicrobium amorphum]|uniref:Colicin V production protein n=1 Tax=Uabimicrobium amorphum TaxID=2596890 RepID=A0A5S9IQR5_UABAM|nr:CvpA family protein [Candidatus Uabimicrobium amorphum]BBM85440.1 hypothetical protein UABAM_03807 [Candidatus Uabimicrobium amorphum]